jgi:hypothetical protein
MIPLNSLFDILLTKRGWLSMKLGRNFLMQHNIQATIIYIDVLGGIYVPELI